MSIFDQRLKYVTCKIWDATQDDFYFPEEDIPEISGKNHVGVAFSGGGTRSAAATLGQLRGLNQLGLLDNVKYISCVSGGSFPSVAYTYLPESWTDKTFLGMVVPPEDLSMEYLQKTDRNSFAHAIANSVIMDDYVKQAARFAGDETYARALGENFLTPFGIDSLLRFFGLNSQTVQDSLDSNPLMTFNDFYAVRRGRPFLIVGSIIIREDNQPPAPARIPFESTPLYVGTRVLHQDAGSNNRDIGGGYVEPFGFDSDEPDRFRRDRPVKVRLGASRYRFTLSDVLGATGAAPAEVLAQIGLPWVGFPEFKYWPPCSPKTRAKEYNFGDGGILENLGIMPLLARKVRRIAVFVNTQHVLTGGQVGQINGSIPPLFGQIPDFMTNHVFPKNKYRKLVEGLLEAKEDGKTVMFQDEYRVVNNERFGIKGGWNVQVLWIYNERVAAWEERLPSEIKGLIGAGSLSNFPHYRTFFQNPPFIIDLSAKQVAMLAHLSCWNVLENSNAFMQLLS